MKLVLFCDYGLDDAAATVDALQHAAQDGYQEVVLVAIGGNVPPEVSLVNAKKLVANCNFCHPPVTIVDTTDEVQPFEFLKNIHGGDGMGDLFAPQSCPVPAVKFDAWLSGFSGEYHLLSLGPMTLVPRTLQRGECKKFVFMGGNVAEVPNFKGYEFNHALDLAAFAQAVKTPHAAVTMDTCRHPLFNVQNEEIAGEDLMHKIVRRAREMTFISGEKGCYLWDDIAVKYLRHPDWFSLESGTDKDGNVLSVARYRNGKKYLEIIQE